ncbi:hypothetical protein ACET3X_002662 [Alternaria dauci]|uniref:Uncharacterized protein n=1 Tax=Alternaria dauci TaxID=48095 RepID=A0ABR3UQN9_9PLEO
MGNLTTLEAAINELDEDGQKLLASSKDPTEDTKPLKLDVTAKGILLPQSVPSSPAIIHTHSQEGVLTLPRQSACFDFVFCSEANQQNIYSNTATEKDDFKSHYRNESLIRNQVSMDSIHANNQSWADEMNAHDDLHSSSPPTSANLPVTSSVNPSPEPSSGLRNETTRHPVPMLRPEMFLNPDEMDQETSYETYAYGLRGDISVTLRSNIQTIIDPALSQAEQKMRNRERCRGMFGSLAETIDNS